MIEHLTIKLGGENMQPRIELTRVAPGALKAMADLEKYVEHCGIETSLLELVRLRGSQMNGCAYCLDMHSKDARAEGETDQRLYTLSAWRETPFFSERERAALEWTEAVTEIGKTHVPDEVFARVHKHFNDAELVNLTRAVVAINGWNRLAISFRAVPGTYQRKAPAAAS
jgi:AhpD family alkylhydroperoxidase